jgi:hypothetical protein
LELEYTKEHQRICTKEGQQWAYTQGFEWELDFDMAAVDKLSLVQEQQQERVMVHR